MAKRATRKAKAGDGIRDLEVDALKAENLHLKEEIERLRLRNAGAHPAAALADALQSSDEAGDSADDALTMYASSMVIRSELMDLLALFKSTIADYEARLDQLASIDVAAGDDAVIELDEQSDDAESDADSSDDTDESEDDAEELVAEADDTSDDDTDEDTSDESEDDAEELVAEADDADTADEDEHEAVTIDLRDKDRSKDKVKSANGSRRNGSNRGRGRQRDNTAPAAKGA